MKKNLKAKEEIISSSENLFSNACEFLPDGNTRHSVFFEPHPLYISEALGANVFDVEGVSRIDFNNNFSSLIHGHCNPEIVAAIKEQVSNLGAVGAPTTHELELAKLLCMRIPSIEHIRFTNSGSEAVMMAIKAARAFTGRSKIAKIEGCYHGTYDFAEISVAPTPDNWGPISSPKKIPPSKGTPESVIDDVIVLPLNNIQIGNTLLNQSKDDLAAIIIDPAPSHLNYVQPTREFLEGLISFCKENNVLLIFDEVYSFRLGLGGAQGIWGIKPDLTTLGKIIGGGIPTGAVGGKKEIMEVFGVLGKSPSVLHGGTFNGNPIAMAAGLASMEGLTELKISQLNEMGQYLRTKLYKASENSEIPFQVTGIGSLSAISFQSGELNDYRDVYPTDSEKKLQRFIHKFMLDHGIFVAPQFQIVLSTAHTKSHIDLFVEIFIAALEQSPKGLKLI